MISFFKKVFSKKIMEMALEQFGSVSIKAFLLYTLLGVGIVFMVVFVCYLFKHKVRLSNLLAGIVIVMYGSIMLQLTLVCCLFRMALRCHSFRLSMKEGPGCSVY